MVLASIANPPPWHRKIIRVGKLKLFVRDTQTQGPTRLCLHGRFGRGETWAGLAQRYARQYRVIAPDQRGHGLSDQPEGKYTAAEMAADAAHILAQLGGGPAIVVGHSMGGRIAGYLAALHPNAVAALAILDQSARGPNIASDLPLEQLPPKDTFTADWPLPFNSLRQARDALLTKTNSQVRADYYLDSLIERHDGYHMMFSQRAMAAIFEYQEDWFHLLPDIGQPTLLVRARDSVELPSADCESMVQRLPNAKTVELARPEHHVYLRDPEAFYRTLDAFLQSAGYTNAL